MVNWIKKDATKTQVSIYRRALIKHKKFYYSNEFYRINQDTRT